MSSTELRFSAFQLLFVGVDGLNFGSTIPGHTWQSAEQLLAAQYTVVRNLVPTKPVAITTLGSTSINGVGMKGSWLSDAMIYLKSMSEFNESACLTATYLEEDTWTDKVLWCTASASSALAEVWTSVVDLL